MTPTPEQSAILDLVQSTTTNLMIRSFAGTGKTTMVEMIEKVVKPPMLYLVFAKKNQIEAEAKLLSTTTVRTFNGLGHRIWAAAVGNVTLAKTKTQDLLRELISASPKNTQTELWEVYHEVVAGVRMAKALGYVPEGKFANAKRLCSRDELADKLEEHPDDLVLDLIDAVLLSSIRAAYAGSIDFDDQVYMPALFGGTYPNYPLVAVDEYQDLNPVNHAMLSKLGRNRVIGVGDECQNIYGFRGAKSSGMAEAIYALAMATAELSISFRCPEAIVREARWRVPQFKASKPGGFVGHLEGISADDFAEDGAIICRNNAPLLRLAFKLLSEGRSVSIAGSDVGPKLVGTMRKLGSGDTRRSQVLDLIETWRAEKLERGSTSAGDLADCMLIFARKADTLGEAIRFAEALFAQRGSLQLLTGHKAKGLEFPTVYFLDEHLCRPNQQDQNLRYVVITRASERLFYIDSDKIKWS